MPNFELMLWIILVFWVLNGIMGIIAGIVFDGEVRRYSALRDSLAGIVSILLAILVLTVV